MQTKFALVMADTWLLINTMVTVMFIDKLIQFLKQSYEIYFFLYPFLHIQKLEVRSKIT